MNDTYFDANLFEELPADHFHKKVLEHATCIASNLMFDAAHPDHTGGVKSANAYHMMIALCEAGLAKPDEKDVAESREFVTKVLTPITKENEREPLPFDRPANVDAETGEVYEVITDEARMIGDGE